MKKYKVIVYYHTNVEINVSANNEEEAIELARQMVAIDDFDIVDTIMEGLQEDGRPDVEEINEN